MSNEHKLIIETELPIPMTCADGTGIAKGALGKVADLFTVSLADGDDDIAGGVVGSEKIASDGMVRVDVYRGGVFRCSASGSIAVGDQLGSCADAPNFLRSNNAVLDISGSRCFGTALETATDKETFLYELRPQVLHTAS